MSEFGGLRKHTNTACTLVCPYTVLLYKEVGCMKSKTRQRSANHEVWNFFKLVEATLKHPTTHPQLPNHCPPLTPPHFHSLTILLLQLLSAL